MRRAGLILIPFIFILLWSDMATSQEEPRRQGVGVSMGKEFGPLTYYSMASLDFPSVYVPIEVSPGFRFEPEIGIWWYSYSGYSYRVFRIGSGMFSVKQKEKTNLYEGARLGVMFNFQSSGASRIDFFVGPALGGEYLFSNHFSLGGEAQFNFTFYNVEGTSEFIFSTKTLMFLRWYF